MASHNPLADSRMLLDLAEDYAEQLPGWKMIKGTVMTGIAVAANILSLLIAFNLDLPEWAMVAAVAVIGAANTLGIKLYTPEPTKRSRNKYQSLLAQQIDNHDACNHPDGDVREDNLTTPELTVQAPRTITFQGAHPIGGSSL